MRNNYTPRRCSKRWLDGDCPDGVLAIIDTGPKDFDRYTVFYAEPIRVPGYPGGDVWIGYRGMSANPFAAYGVGVYGELPAHAVAAFRYANKHRYATWSSLPEDVKRAVRRDMEEAV